MRSCPQCHSVYGDDFAYCLNDGAILAPDDEEQATVVRANSPVFGSAGAAAAPARELFDPARTETPTMVAGIFAPPPQIERVRSTSYKAILFVGLGLVVLLCVIGVGAALIISSGKKGTTPPNSSPANPSVTNPKRSEPETKLSHSFTDRVYVGSVSGRRSTQQLTMTLSRDGEKLTGRAETDKSWDKLDGTIDDDGTFRLDGLESGTAFTGNWSGRISADGTISGTWNRSGGGQSASFDLRFQQ